METLPKYETIKLRKKHFSNACKLWYPMRPLKIVRARGQYMYDEEGTEYLDCINNVCHVGHSHPRVVRAASEQMALVNTNNRFLHDTMVQYAQRLTATMPEKLSVCFFVNSGSEANDLAIQLAQRFSAHKDIITLDHAYHGHLQTVLAISPYKKSSFLDPNKLKWVHVVSPPDMYRGKHCDEDNPSEAYANDVKAVIDDAHSRGRKIAAYFAESLQSCGGQLVYPPGYLKNVYGHVRAAGGVCVADEVQVGFGRVGAHWWGFQLQDVVPDIVTMGKPMGNGHPIAAVITTREIANSFEDGGFQYFNTYGGNPVSCAVGMAVLDVIEEEKLRENCVKVGTFLLEELTKLKEDYKTIGDVRGVGLFVGIELVESRETKVAGVLEAAFVVEYLREENILMSTEGPLGNVLKLKPPACFSMTDGQRLLVGLARALQAFEGLDQGRLQSLGSDRANHHHHQVPLSTVMDLVSEVRSKELNMSPSGSSKRSPQSDDSGISGVDSPPVRKGRIAEKGRVIDDEYGDDIDEIKRRRTDLD